MEHKRVRTLTGANRAKRKEANKMENEEVKIQPIMVDVVTDARISLNKVAQVLTKINQGLTNEEKLQLRDELEGLAFSSAIILMDAEMALEEEGAKGDE